MGTLRAEIESDLADTVEGEFSLPVEMVDPDGNVYSTKNGTTDPLVGGVLYDRTKTNPETGEPIVVHEPVVILRRSSLWRIPLPGENWVIRIPLDPTAPSTLTDFALGKTRAPEGGDSIGFIKFYPQKAKQA